MDLQAFFKLSYGLYVVSSCADDKDSALIVNTVTQVTAVPERIAVTISKNSYTAKLIKKSGKFCATVLEQDAPMELIGRFGFQSGETVDKFDGIETSISANGIKYCKENACAVFSINVSEIVDIDTHTMFIGQVVEATTLSKNEPMTYAYYHKVKNGATPKDAPSYKGEDKVEESSQKTGYRCTICNYIANLDVLPDDFICPICKKTKEFFVKV